MPVSLPPLPRRRGFRRVLPALLLVVSVPSGCSLLESDQPDRVRVQVEVSGSQPVRIIVSREFLVTPVGEGDEQSISVQFISADTLVQAVPFDQSYALAPTYRVLARAEGLDEENPVPVRLRVSVDGTERFNQSRTVPGELLQFIYIFQ